MNECPNCHILVLGSSCTQCGWSIDGSSSTSTPSHLAELENPTSYDWLGSDSPAWEARDSSSRYDAEPPAIERAVASPVPAHHDSGVIEEADGGGGFFAKFAPLRMSGLVVQVDQPRSETVSLSGHNAAQMAASGCLTAPLRAMGILMGILFAPLRFLMIPSMMFRGPEGPNQLSIPINTFLLQTHSGDSVECMLRGELRGGSLRQGDEVDVEGRLSRHGVLTVSSMVNARTGATTTAYVDPRAKGGILRAVLMVVFLILAIWFLVSAF